MYAMIDRGYSNTRNITDFAVIGMTPCLYAKTIVDKIFENAAYTYTNDSYFNDDRFKRLILSPPNGLSLAATTISGRQFQASRITTAQTLQIGSTMIFQDFLIFFYFCYCFNWCHAVKQYYRNNAGGRKRDERNQQKIRRGYRAFRGF